MHETSEQSFLIYDFFPVGHLPLLIKNIKRLNAKIVLATSLLR